MACNKALRVVEREVAATRAARSADEGQIKEDRRRLNALSGNYSSAGLHGEDNTALRGMDDDDDGKEFVEDPLNAGTYRHSFHCGNDPNWAKNYERTGVLSSSQDVSRTNSIPDYGKRMSERDLLLASNSVASRHFNPYCLYNPYDLPPRELRMVEKMDRGEVAMRGTERYGRVYSIFLHTST